MSYKLCKNEQLVSQMSIITLQTGPAWPNYAHNASPSKSQGWSTLSSAVSRQSAIFLAGGGTLQWSAHWQTLARQEMIREEIVLLLYKYLLTRLSTDYSKVNQILKSMTNFNSPVIKKNTQTQVCWEYEIKKGFLFIWAWGFFKTRQLLVDCELPFKMWTRNCRGGAELSSWVFILHWLLHNVPAWLCGNCQIQLSSGPINQSLCEILWACGTVLCNVYNTISILSYNSRENTISKFIWL